MVKRLLPLFVGVFIFLTCSSDDNSTGPKNTTPTGPLFKITVVDTLGNPAVGIRVGSMNHSPYFLAPGLALDAQVTTNICFTVPETGTWGVHISDYYGGHIAEFAGVVTAGTHCINWDPSGLKRGFYLYNFSFIPADDFPILNAKKAVILETGLDPQQSILDITDSEGEFETDDTLLFPCLLGNPPVVTGYDAIGNILYETDDFYHDSVTITLSIPSEPNKFMKFKRALQVGPNAFNLTWDPKLAE